MQIKKNILNGLITVVDSVQSSRDWLSRHTSAALRSVYSRVYTNTVVTLRLHAMYGEDTLYNIYGVVGLVRFCWTHSLFSWGHWKMMNYGVKLPADYTHLMLYDPTLEVIFYETRFKTVLCQPYEIFPACLVNEDKQTLLDHTKLVDTITDIIYTREIPRFLLCQLGETDITAYMKDLYLSDRITVYDLSLYMYHKHGVMVPPDQCKLICMLDNDTLDTIQYLEDDIPFLKVVSDPDQDRDRDRDTENTILQAFPETIDSNEVCLIDTT
jgi:hypothetical protein